MRGKNSIKHFLRRTIMKCLCTGDQIPNLRMAGGSNGSSGTRHTSSTNGERIDNENIEEAESDLREAAAGLNYEEARALLGRLEYLKGNMQEAISVFEGINIDSTIFKIKLALSIRADPKKAHSHQLDERPLRLPAVSLLLEAIYLKSRARHDLGHYKEAADECSKILDMVESSLPANSSYPNKSTVIDSKIHETISKFVQFLPELYKLTGEYQQVISSYRRALLTCYNLEITTLSKIQKDFAIFLLYGGVEANSPNLMYQRDSSFVPGNNLEEAILLLLILLRNINTKKIEWDPSVMDHLTFAMSVSGQLKCLTREFEEIIPSFIERKEALYSLALCYFGEKDDQTALGLLRQIVNFKDELGLGFSDPNVLRALLFASKICGEESDMAKEGVQYAKRAIFSLRGFRCDKIESVVHSLLGVSLSTQARSTSSESERAKLQKDALEALQNAEKKMTQTDYNLIYNLALENAEQRKLDEALKYAKKLVKFEFGSNVKTWILLARILSAQKRYIDAENAINAALDQTGKWDQAELLRTKAKIQISRGLFRNAVESYTHLLAIIQLKNKSFSAGMEILKGVRNERTMEIETWYDLAHVYLKMNQLLDVELCLLKIKQFNSYSPLYWHLTGKWNESKGNQKEALNAYTKALDVDPTHVPSLVSLAIILQKSGGKILAVRSYLTDALRLDRTNHVAWFHLGLVYQSEGATSATEAAECFQAASVLEETAPVEPFR